MGRPQKLFFPHVQHLTGNIAGRADPADPFAAQAQRTTSMGAQVAILQMFGAELAHANHRAWKGESSTPSLRANVTLWAAVCFSTTTIAARICTVRPR